MTPIALFLLHDRARSRRHRRGYVSLLPHARWPTQFRATPFVAFRVWLLEDGASGGTKDVRGLRSLPHLAVGDHAELHAVSSAMAGASAIVWSWFVVCIDQDRGSYL